MTQHAAWTDRQRYFATMMGYTMHGLKPEWMEAEQNLSEQALEPAHAEAAQETTETVHTAPHPVGISWMVDGDWVTDAQSLPAPQNTVLADIQRAAARLLRQPQTTITFVLGRAPTDMDDADVRITLPSLVDLSVTPYLREQAWALMLKHAHVMSHPSN